LIQASKLKIWNKQNNIFELVENSFKWTCETECTHEYGNYNSVQYKQDILIININNIPTEFKQFDKVNNLYWVNPDAFLSLKELFC